ncbi:MAG: hypothetical protein PHQ05_10175 [Sterolibacterium sp.]|nr:hypothetical protein [Sterolibacterium sp.]
MGKILFAVFIIFCCGLLSGWSWQGARAEARIQTIKAEQEKATGDAARQAAKDLKSAQDRADAIDNAAAIRTADLEQKLQEKRNALKTATFNRPCLGGPALRLLGESPGLKLGLAETATASPLYRGSSTAAADPPNEGEDYATDTQIADWIAGAAVLYERCRGRIRDIRAWSDGEK